MALESLLPKLTNEECLRIFYSLRWPKGPKCPRCQKTQCRIYKTGWRSDIRRYYCPGCRIWFNDFTGTIFDGSRLSLKDWFCAIYYFLRLNLAASQVAGRLGINRNSAGHLRQAILKERLFCELILGKITSDIHQAMEFLMSRKDTQDYLGISQRTLYRLVSTGALSASKVGGQWRFKPEDVQKYITHKLNRYGTTAIPETILFRPEVLDKYRKDKTKYYLQEEAYQGWVGSKEDYNLMQNALSILGKGAKDTGALGQIAFYDLHYRKVVAPQGQPSLAISQKDYAALPSEEYAHWSGYRINQPN